MTDDGSPEPCASRWGRERSGSKTLLTALLALIVGCGSGPSPSAGASRDVPADPASDESTADVGTVALPLTLEEDEKIVAADGADRQAFGLAIAVRGPRALVTGGGHPAFQAEGPTVVLERPADAPGPWAQIAVLEAPGDTPRARLGPGAWVALQDDRALVGAGVAFGPGAAEAGKGLDVFTAEGWAWSTRLEPPAPVTADRGPTVAADGDRLLVGAPAPPLPSPDVPGAAWIYERSGDGYVLADTLDPPDGAPAGWAQAVALQGDLAVVGSGILSAPPSGPGAVHLYERSASGDWQLTQTLTPGDAPGGARFGHAVALDGDRLLVGAPNDAPAGLHATGAAYLFERTGDGSWGLVHTLTPPDGGQLDRFGKAVALEGDVAVVGAPSHPVSLPETPPARPIVGPGAVYVFARDVPSAEAWGLSAKLVPSDGETQQIPTFALAPQPSQLGHAVALDDGVLLAGAPWDDNERGTDAGAVYVMVLDLDRDGVPDPQDVCPDTPASDSAAGVPAAHLGPHRWVYDGEGFVTGPTEGAAPQPPVSLQDTRGCSCGQVAEQKGAGTAHLRFGCSRGLLTSWADCLQSGDCP